MIMKSGKNRTLKTVGSTTRPQPVKDVTPAGCRLVRRVESCIAGSWRLMAADFQLFADGPHRPFLDFTMARDAGDLVQRRVEPNAMGSTLAIQNATMEPQMAFQFREFHASAVPTAFEGSPATSSSVFETICGADVLQTCGKGGPVSGRETGQRY